jgi:hypothetical protein
VSRRLIWGFIIIVLIGIGGFLAFLLLPDTESYEGKPLAFWLSEVDYGQPPARREAAAKGGNATNALRRISSAALRP